MKHIQFILVVLAVLAADAFAQNVQSTRIVPPYGAVYRGSDPLFSEPFFSNSISAGQTYYVLQDPKDVIYSDAVGGLDVVHGPGLFTPINSTVYQATGTRSNGQSVTNILITAGSSYYGKFYGDASHAAGSVSPTNLVPINAVYDNGTSAWDVLSGENAGYALNVVSNTQYFILRGSLANDDTVIGLGLTNGGAGWILGDLTQTNIFTAQSNILYLGGINPGAPVGFKVYLYTGNSVDYYGNGTNPSPATYPDGVDSRTAPNTVAPVFLFGVDSRTSVNNDSGTNVWPWYFYTNLLNSSFGPASVTRTNFILYGAPGKTVAAFYTTMSGGGYTFPTLQAGQKGYFILDGDVNDIDIGTSVSTIESNHTNFYNYVHSKGYSLVVCTPYPTVPFNTNNNTWTSCSTLSAWLSTNQGFAWDYLIPVFENLNPNYLDIIHTTPIGNAFIANLAMQGLFGNRYSGAIVDGNKGIIFYPLAAFPTSLITNGRSGIWDSNGVATYMRTSVVGSTNWTDHLMNAH